jgi:hypothetical protein
MSFDMTLRLWAKRIQKPDSAAVNKQTCGREMDTAAARCDEVPLLLACYNI